MRVWVDTDVGDDPDDAVALLLAVHHPEVELAGVSTVSGDVEHRAALARELVGEEVPVAAGSPRLAELVEAAEPDVLVAIGPLTNVARLLDAGARPPPRFVAMGGVLEPVRHRGRLRDVETNFGADPAATRFVLDWTHALVVPLDVTSRMVLTEQQEDALGAARPELSPHTEAWRAPLCLHDPLALLVAAGEEVGVRLERRDLSADREGRVVERRGARSHEVVTDVDADEAIRAVLSRLGC